MEEKCKKCNSKDLFVEIQGQRRGLYCGQCGKWQKWITKEELQIAKFRGLKIIIKNQDQDINFEKESNHIPRID